MPLSESAAAFIERLVDAGFKPFHLMRLNEARSAMATLFEMMGPGPAAVESTYDEIQVDGGSIAIRLLEPPGAPRACIVYYHGGGWTLGSIADYDGFARRLAVGTQCAVILVDYRLAPEHPYPTAVDDAFAAVKWTEEHYAAPNGLPLLVAGDSAGGNLAAVVTRRARATSSPSLQGQVLISPILTAKRVFPSQTDVECEILIGRDDMTWFWDHYAPQPEMRLSIDAAPLSAPDFVGLPPALIISGDLDVSRDEAEEYCRKLSDADVPVKYSRYDGEFHAFAVFGNLPSSDEAIREIAEFVGEEVAPVATNTLAQ